MGEVNVGIERVIVQHLPPSVSQSDIDWAKCELCWAMARHYAKDLPQKYRANGGAILEKSAVFRQWFLVQFHRFNTGIAAMFTDNLIDGTIDLTDWMGVQRRYFDETNTFPDSATMGAIIAEWKAKKQAD